ncbi:MAG: ABC transporter substrate-binding protein [Desulfobulbaceae bacterium]|nr:ABC transporter substrate-binding protein [Desulfobulbaceae bacterium]
MKKTIKAIRLLIFLVVLGVLWSCDNNTNVLRFNEAANKEKRNELTIAYGLDTDARSARGNGDMLLNIFTTERLVEIEGTDVVPSLAESWEIKEGGKIIEFKLREDVHFSDGSPFNAEAVEFTFSRLMHFGHHAWTEVDRIEKMEVLSPYLVAFHYKEGMSGYIALTGFAEYGCSILSPHSVTPNGDPTARLSGLVGTGPWMIEEYREDQFTTFSPNPNYHGEKPILSKITVKTVPKAEARVLAIQSGDADVVVDYYHGGSAYTPRNMLKQLSDMGFLIAKKEMPMTTYLVFNYKNAPWTDTNVRKAFNLAIKRDDIAALYDGWINTAQHYLFSDTAPYITDLEMAMPKYDTSEAKKLLAAAGFEMKATLIAQGQNPDEVKLCELIKAQLAAAGVDIRLDVLEPGEYVERKSRGDYDLLIYYVGGPERRKFTRMEGRFNPEAAEFGNYGFFAHPAISPVIKTAVESFDEGERKEAFRTFYQLVNDLSAGVPLYFNAVFVVSKPEVKGIKFVSSEPRFDSVSFSENGSKVEATTNQP